MLGEEKLVSISPKDIPSLIATYARVGRPRDFDAISSLQNYQRWLQSPTDYNFEVLTLNNDWATDGLFLFVVRQTFKIVLWQVV